MKSNYFPQLTRVLGAVCMSITVLACSGVAAPSSDAPAPLPVTAAAPVQSNSSSDLMLQLQAAVGTAACDSPAQCKTVAIGHKACGGPESYMAYSTKADGAGVSRLAQRYADARKGENQRGGMVSNCMLLRDPGATCTAGRCVTLQPGQGSVSER